MAQKSNYALISALYANETKGLYSDIYFPIIKYSIAKIYTKKDLDASYCTVDKISEYIKEIFGIEIPTIVVEKSVLKISKISSEINLKVYENGNSFRILNAAFDDVDVDNKEVQFTSKLGQIERTYQEFLTLQGCYDDKVSFLQFITDNTDDILGYFEDEDASKVDERYVTLVFFLQYLSDNDKDLYAVANQLFWSSVIVAFLKSERPQVDDDCEGIKSEFYLDTSIVMGLLNLSNPLREIYSKEVCDVIKSSGGILRVNPITLEEIKYILQSVEGHGPNPSTDIASACERRQLKANDLAKVRLHIETMVEELGVNVFPIMSEEQKHKVKKSYSGKKVIQLLGEYRNKNLESYSADTFREIHDIYMDDFIKDRRKSKSDIENVYFLTANVDLISFCKAQHPSANYMISTGKVILDLWMHNVKPVDISSCALTETMAHCLDLHSVKVRNKIAEVSRYYNHTKDNFDPLVYKDFIHKLYRRAKNVIVTIDTDPDAQNRIGSSWGKLIQEAVDADNEHYNKAIAAEKNKNVTLEATISAQNEELENVRQALDVSVQKESDNQSKISELTSDNSTLKAQLQQSSKDLDAKEKAISEQKIATEVAHAKIKLHERKAELMSEILKLEGQLVPLKTLREASFHNYWPKFLIGFGIILVLLPITFFVLNISGIFSLETYQYWFFPFLGALAIYLFNRANSMSSQKGKRQEKAYKKWERKNTSYVSYNKKLESLKNELDKINEQL